MVLTAVHHTGAADNMATAAPYFKSNVNVKRSKAVSPNYNEGASCSWPYDKAPCYDTRQITQTACGIF